MLKVSWTDFEHHIIASTKLSVLPTSVFNISSVIRQREIFVFLTTTFYFQAFVSKVSKTGKNVLKVSRTDFEHPIISIILSQRCFFEIDLYSLIRDVSSK